MSGISSSNGQLTNNHFTTSPAGLVGMRWECDVIGFGGMGRVVNLDDVVLDDDAADDEGAM